MRYAAALAKGKCMQFGSSRREFVTMVGGAVAWPAGIRTVKAVLPAMEMCESRDYS